MTTTMKKPELGDTVLVHDRTNPTGLFIQAGIVRQIRNLDDGWMVDVYVFEDTGRPHRPGLLPEHLAGERFWRWWTYRPGKPEGL
jgi:hypothetical protein